MLSPRLSARLVDPSYTPRGGASSGLQGESCASPVARLLSRTQDRLAHAHELLLKEEVGNNQPLQQQQQGEQQQQQQRKQQAMCIDAAVQVNISSDTPQQALPTGATVPHTTHTTTITMVECGMLAVVDVQDSSVQTVMGVVDVQDSSIQAVMSNTHVGVQAMMNDTVVNAMVNTEHVSVQTTDMHKTMVNAMVNTVPVDTPAMGEMGVQAVAGVMDSSVQAGVEVACQHMGVQAAASRGIECMDAAVQTEGPLDMEVPAGQQQEGTAARVVELEAALHAAQQELAVMQQQVCV